MCKKTEVMRISRPPPAIEIMIGTKQLDNVGYLNNLHNVITDDTRCTREIKPRTVVAKGAFNKMKAIVTSKLDVNVRKKHV